jgi:heme/copper-type cytochrome/quinol oxidase subunit 2
MVSALDSQHLSKVCVNFIRENLFRQACSFSAPSSDQIMNFQAWSLVSSTLFMLAFIGVLIPIMLFYIIYNYIAFRGKVSA